jgi:hypothetical protein
VTGSIASKSGSQNARAWVIALSNPGPGTAYGTQVTGFTLSQTSGAACTPVISSPGAVPIALGDIASGASASASFTIDFTGCAALARFSLSVPYNFDGGASTGTMVRGNEFR